jgi:hypothetical protein
MTAVLEIRFMCNVAKYTAALLMTLRLHCSEVMNTMALKVAECVTFLWGSSPIRVAFSGGTTARVVEFQNCGAALSLNIDASDQ